MANDIVEKLPNTIFNRNDLLMVLKNNKENNHESTVRYELDKYLKSGEIVRVGRNKYIKSNLLYSEYYKNEYSDAAETIITFMAKNYPFLDFQLWELNWMNEFVNHLIAQNIIFLEVEKDACTFVFNDLKENKNMKILLKPTQKEMDYYTANNTVIVIPRISGSPVGKMHKYNVPLEKIIVDLFANKYINISRSEYPDAIGKMFEKYIVEYAKLFRYAGRRNKEEELKCFLRKTLPQNIYTK